MFQHMREFLDSSNLVEHALDRSCAKDMLFSLSIKNNVHWDVHITSVDFSLSR
jgi:hypothetical protein